MNQPPSLTTRTRRLTIVAQDPAVKDDGRKILTTQVEVPAETLARGPRGYRVHVIDYDSSTRTLYKPLEYPPPTDGVYVDPFAGADDHTILEDPGFHAQNAYAIVMRTLARFEFALGRRVGWDVQGHQLKVAPHAFADANAFYSEHDEALLFGYFPGRGGNVFACLSHDVVAHETTHAIIDGLRERFTDPSSPDQAAFHEGFADIVALLSVFSLRDVVRAVLDRTLSGAKRPAGRGRGRRDLVRPQDVTQEALRESLLFGLAKQMGQEMSAVRGGALRQSATLTPTPTLLREDEFQEPHRRGEILVAAVMNAFIGVWTERLTTLGKIDNRYLNRDRVVEEASDAADYLLTMCIRAMDYTPPVHLEFGDFLSALLTADHQIRPDDSKYHFRDHLVMSFKRYGIAPASSGNGERGLWQAPSEALDYHRTHFEAMQRDPDEVFRFVWENRGPLGLFEDAYTRILTVRPCIRIAPDDGFPLRETVVQCMQHLEVEASALRRLGIAKPAEMPGETPVKLQGGITLIFDEYGQLKFAISNQLHDRRRPEVQAQQSRRLQHLWDYGHFNRGASLTRRFSAMHRLRSTDAVQMAREGW